MRRIGSVFRTTRAAVAAVSGGRLSPPAAMPGSAKPPGGTADSRVLPAAFRASGLPVYWARQYVCLRTPEAAAAAEAHVVGTLATLPLPSRLACAVALRALPAAFWLATGRPLHRASAESGAAGMARLTAIPGVAGAVRAGTALALYGALDGQPDAGRDAGGSGAGGGTLATELV